MRLKSAATACRPQEMGLDRQDVMDAIYYAKEMRTGRYNSLWMLEALGLQEAIGSAVCSRLGL